MRTPVPCYERRTFCVIYVTSDLHGYPKNKFLRFLSDSGFSENDELYILGDVIDRNGDGGIEMLRWIMEQPNVHFLLGNHEDMLLQCSFLFEEITDPLLDSLSDLEMAALMNWMDNGAQPTINSLRRLSHDSPGELRRLLDFLEDTPLYAVLTVSGKKYILTHAGLGHYEQGKELVDYDTGDLLWFRPELTTRYDDAATVVFGHTPVAAFGPEYEDKMLKTETWIDIDTGAAYGLHPMLLRLGDEKAFYLSEE